MVHLTANWNFLSQVSMAQQTCCSCRFQCQGQNTRIYSHAPARPLHSTLTNLIIHQSNTESYTYYWCNNLSINYVRVPREEGGLEKSLHTLTWGGTGILTKYFLRRYFILKIIILKVILLVDCLTHLCIRLFKKITFNNY